MVGSCSPLAQFLVAEDSRLKGGCCVVRSMDTGTHKGTLTIIMQETFLSIIKIRVHLGAVAAQGTYAKENREPLIVPTRALL